MGGIGGGGWWWVMVVLLLLLVLRSADLAAVDVVLEGLDAKNLLCQLCDAVPEGIRLSAAAWWGSSSVVATVAVSWHRV